MQCPLLHVRKTPDQQHCCHLCSPAIFHVENSGDGLREQEQSAIALLPMLWLLNLLQNGSFLSEAFAQPLLPALKITRWQKASQSQLIYHESAKCLLLCRVAMQEVDRTLIGLRICNRCVRMIFPA